MRIRVHPWKPFYFLFRKPWIQATLNLHHHGILNGNERNNFIYIYTSLPPPCKQDLPAGNEMRGNLSHARNGRGIKFSLPILSPSRKKQSYILRGRTPPIHGGGFCKNSIFLSHLPSPFLVKVERSVGLALPVTGRRERTIFVSFKRDKNIVTRSQSVFLSTDCYRLFFFFFLNRPDSFPPRPT